MAALSPRHGELRTRLRAHPLYGSLRSIAELRNFMEHHVYAVWDFMSLVKALQAHVAPVRTPWTPPQNARHASFVNRLALEEESDAVPVAAGGATYASHFEIYLRAMTEVGADTAPVARFLSVVHQRGINAALGCPYVPAPARRFMATTFDIIGRDTPHVLASALAHGREEIVPLLFRELLSRLPLGRESAPNLYGYLERHVELDEQQHGPIAIAIARELCGDCTGNIAEATLVAELSLTARLEFWDAIHAAARRKAG